MIMMDEEGEEEVVVEIEVERKCDYHFRYYYEILSIDLNLIIQSNI
jgi:hypothetical protein